MKIYDIKVKDIVNDVLDKEGYSILLSPDRFEEAINSYSLMHYEECFLIMQGLKNHLIELLMMNLTTPLFAFVGGLRLHLKLDENEALFLINMMNNIIDGFNFIIEIANIDEVEQEILASDNKEALRILATSYYEGYGVQQDYEKAYGLFQECAARGDDEAYYYLGMMNEKGLGTEVDLDKARLYYQTGVDLEENECYYGLGMMDLEGGFIDEAVKLLDESEDPRSYRTLGHIYLEDQDYEQAFHEFLAGAEIYDPECMYQVGKMYLKGQWTMQDEILAVKNFAYAYYAGHPKATYYLALCVLNGIGTTQDSHRGIELLKQAGRMGDDSIKSLISDRLEKESYEVV
ncbi:MAG: sel1 repeat family protein [Erysipelotrichaceae bacterium]|nr:sel1 repeat family protein [Erysipelotrichaceae bacterium]